MKCKLSMAFSDLRGSDGTVTARGSRSGLTLVKQIRPRQVESEAVLDVRANLDEISRTFKGMDESGAEMWNRYGASLQKTNPVNGTSYSSTGIAAFQELNGVLLRIPGVTGPALTPPTTTFVPPSIDLSLEVEGAALLVTGTAQTQPNVRLEIAVARLASKNRKIPKAGYVSAGFFPLRAQDGFKVHVPESAGYYAVRARWASATDGQTSRWRSLGKATIALSVTMGGADAATGEAMAPVAKPARMRKAA